MFNFKSWIPRTTTLLYLTLLLFHISHSDGERHEGASFITNWYQDYQTYSNLEIIAYVVALVIFILYLMRIKWSYYTSISYAVIMIIDGLYHIISIIIEGKTYHSNALSITTSVGFILVGLALAKSLRKNKT